MLKFKHCIFLILALELSACQDPGLVEPLCHDSLISFPDHALGHYEFTLPEEAEEFSGSYLPTKQVFTIAVERYQISLAADSLPRPVITGLFPTETRLCQIGSTYILERVDEAGLWIPEIIHFSAHEIRSLKLAFHPDDLSHPNRVQIPHYYLPILDTSRLRDRDEPLEFETYAGPRLVIDNRLIEPEQLIRRARILSLGYAAKRVPEKKLENNLENNMGRKVKVLAKLAR